MDSLTNVNQYQSALNPKDPGEFCIVIYDEFDKSSPNMNKILSSIYDNGRSNVIRFFIVNKMSNMTQPFLSRMSFLFEFKTLDKEDMVKYLEFIFPDYKDKIDELAKKLTNESMSVRDMMNFILRYIDEENPIQKLTDDYQHYLDNEAEAIKKAGNSGCYIM